MKMLDPTDDLKVQNCPGDLGFSQSRCCHKITHTNTLTGCSSTQDLIYWKLPTLGTSHQLLQLNPFLQAQGSSNRTSERSLHCLPAASKLNSSHKSISYPCLLIKYFS